MGPKSLHRGVRESGRAHIKCDGPDVCRAGSLSCTRWPLAAEVAALEGRVRAAEQLLDRLFPGVDFTSELGPSIDIGKWEASPATALANAAVKHPMIPLGPKKRRMHTFEPQHDSSGEETFVSDTDEEEDSLHLSGSRSYSITRISSPVGLVKQAAAAVPSATAAAIRADRMPRRGRPEFWRLPHFEADFRTFLPSRRYELPPRDLLLNLIDLWFTTLHIYFPFLHRGLMEQQLIAGLHAVDNRFARCCYWNSDDPRVQYAPGQHHSAGWGYFEQVEPMLTALVPATPDLIDLQILLLAALYLSPSVTFGTLGLMLLSKGLRMAQMIEAHRNKAYSRAPNLVDELWKRVFWSFIISDRFTCILVGKRSSILDEDFDLDLPMIIDDDGWDLSDAGRNFPLKHPQPEDRPTVLSYWIAGYIGRSLYSISQFKLIKSASVVMEMDSALNEWAAEIPEHLRWNPERTNLTWLGQSAALKVGYHNTQLLLHRPFMFQHKLGLPSLAICSNAARGIANTFDVQERRSGSWHLWQTPSMLIGGVVLMLDLWNKLRETGKLPSDPMFKDYWRELQLSLDVLGRFEKRWHPAGKFVDILLDLAKLTPNCDEHLFPEGHHLATSANTHQRRLISRTPTESVVHTVDMFNFPIFSQRVSAPEQSPTPHFWPGTQQTPLAQNDEAMLPSAPLLGVPALEAEFGASLWSGSNDVELSFFGVDLQPYSSYQFDASWMGPPPVEWPTPLTTMENLVAPASFLSESL
ncbi:hypothetical protein BKA62DRAFT_697544 [Auriculariales sp. MPI-PUGE-AT-0066]|nr:hypothetical protein BKA62DRAFT_697544 [Auriculariales sp. MPI-PUGE-AT-0066]